MGDESRPDRCPFSRKSAQLGRFVVAGWDYSPFDFATLRGRLESNDAGVLFLEQSEAMLVVVINNTSVKDESLIRNTVTDTDPANRILSLYISKSVILLKGVLLSSDLRARKAQKNTTMTYNSSDAWSMIFRII